MRRTTELVVVLCGLLCAVSAFPSIPSMDPDDYPLFRRISDNCVPNTTCTYFVGLVVNANDSDYLDFYLSGAATGWVAIGFSPSPSARGADVVGCSVESSGAVLAIDTYISVTLPNNNILDAEQGDIVQGSGVLENLRTTCSFSRLIAGQQQPPQDLNLDADFFFIFGFSNDRRQTLTAGFSQHELSGASRPTVLEQMVNPVRDKGELPLMASGQPPTVPAPTAQPADYRLRQRSPNGCDPQSCDFFMGIRTNDNTSDYLDFYLTANVAGWVAIGFSGSPNMSDADVVGCNHDSTGSVAAVDTYNPVEGRINIFDTTPSAVDIVLHSSTFDNGRITCIFSRRVTGSDAEPQDRPLNTDYYFLFGVGEGGGSGNFPNHQPLIPPVSDGQFNPLTDEGDIGIAISRFRQQLLQAHGILMLIAWPILAFTAIFFAAWMKQALPNGEWFQVHRAFHIKALFVAVIGFILAFVANKDSNTPGLIELGSQNKSGTAHFVFGIIIMALQIANPIISIFRCKPTGDCRWIFNLIHGFLIGLGVEFLAYTNIGIGVSIFSETESDFGDLTIFWVYLAFAIFGVVLNSGLLLFFTFEACFKGAEGTKLAPAVTKPFFNKVYGSADGGAPQGVEMRGPGEQEKPAEPPPRKSPSADAPFRWLGLGLFLGVMLPLIFAVIVMIAATGNTD